MIHVVMETNITSKLKAKGGRTPRKRKDETDSMINDSNDVFSNGYNDDKGNVFGNDENNNDVALENKEDSLQESGTPVAVESSPDYSSTTPAVNEEAEIKKESAEHSTLSKETVETIVEDHEEKDLNKKIAFEEVETLAKEDISYSDVQGVISVIAKRTGQDEEELLRHYNAQPSAKNILAQGLGFVENETESSSMKQEAITSTQKS